MRRFLKIVKPHARKVFAASLISSVTAFGWHLSNQSALQKQAKNEDFQYFRDASTNDLISSSLRTGDLLLFQRGMPEKFSFRSLYCYLSRQASGSPWDHIAVIVRDRDPHNQVPYVLEACASGVQFFPFDERVLKSSSSVIAMRRLSFENESTRDSLSRDLIAMEIAQHAFRRRTECRASFSAYLWSCIFPSGRNLKANLTRSLDQKQLMLHLGDVRSEIASIQRQLDSSESNCSADRELLTHILDKRRKELPGLEADVAFRKNNRTLFSSSFQDIQIVVQFYQQLGILPEFPFPEDYRYQDFVHELKGRLPLRNARLSPEVYIRA